MTDTTALVEQVARAMQAVSRPSIDPDQITPGPRGSVQPMRVWQLYEHMAQAAVDVFATCLAEIEGAAYERAAEKFQAAIEDGYDVPARKVDQCQHDKFGWEDCIACYDQHLMATVEEVRALATTGRNGGGRDG